MVEKPDKPIEQVIREDGRYPPEAFSFLHEGLGRAVEMVHGGGEAPPGQRHVTGQQLCEGLRNLAIERWGLLARAVLEKWNIRCTLDFGNMVYLMIDSGHMKRTDEDSIEDFRDVFDFDDAFRLDDAFEIRE